MKGVYFRVLQMKCLSKCLVSRNLLYPEKFLTAPLNTYISSEESMLNIAAKSPFPSDVFLFKTYFYRSYEKQFFRLLVCMYLT